MSEHTRGPWQPEAVANARLIAAAPDLLDACKLMLRAIRDGGVSTIECVNTAADAIAKATGAEGR